MDDFLARLEKQVWAIWLPVVASAALAIGFALGMVCQRPTRNAESITYRSVTTDANAGSSRAASRFAAEHKASLRGLGHQGVHKRHAQQMVHGGFSFRS